MIKTAILILVIPALIGIAFVGESAAVTNPYFGGSNQDTTVTAFKQIYGYNNFAGSTPTSMTSDLLSIISTSGWSTSSSDATGVIYQGAIRLNKDNNVYADPQVWYKGTEEFGCSKPSGNNANNCPIIDQGNTNSYDYQTFYWDSGRTQVTFYLEGDDTNGSAYYSSPVYSKNSTDTSNAFADGSVYKSSTEPYSDGYYSLLQFGMESDSDTTNWQAKQYDMTYYTTGGSTVNLSSKTVAAIEGDHNDATYGSLVTWTYDSQGQPVGWWVGSNTYSINADSHNTDSNMPDGDVVWAPKTPYTSASSTLWP